MFGLRVSRLYGATIMFVVSSVFSSSGFTSDNEARALLEAMSDEIAGLNSFVVKGEAYTDARLEAGQIIEHASVVTLRVRRPDAMRLTLSSIDEVKELYFGNNILVLYSQTENFYAQTKVEGDIETAANYAVNEIGIDAPMLDMLSNNIASQFRRDAEKLQLIGQDIIRGELHNHIAFRLPEIDVQIWIAANNKPLPRKMVITAKWEGGSPRTVVFFEWDTNPGFKNDAVRFTPPADASEIEFLLESQE